MFERSTWPLRKFFWWLEEKVFWPLSDTLHGRGEHAAPDAVGAEPEAKRGRPDLRVAVATVGIAAVLGIGVAALLAGIGGGSSSSVPASVHHVAATPSLPAADATKSPSGRSSTLHGVTPNFKASSTAPPPQASAKTQAQDQVSPLQGTNSKPSSIPAAEGGGAAALSTARDFAGAFVLYEVGKTNAKVKKTFARTATPGLVKALKDRPPRLPGSVKVPKARVQNVVLGPQSGKQTEASVSLLRLGALSELRLTLTQLHKRWAVSEVRG